MFCSFATEKLITQWVFVVVVYRVLFWMNFQEGLSSKCSVWNDMGSSQCSVQNDTGSNKCSVRNGTGSSKCSVWNDMGSSKCSHME